MNPVFLESVHVSPPPGELTRLKYVTLAGTGNRVVIPRAVQRPPMKASPLRSQIRLAVSRPKEFERAMDQALLVNLFFLRNGPFRTTLCPSVLNPDLCLNGRFCPHAGSLAELYANNVHLNPQYKTKPCEYLDRCQKKADCSFGHPGELMRRLETTAKGRIHVHWYILNA